MPKETRPLALAESLPHKARCGYTLPHQPTSRRTWEGSGADAGLLLMLMLDKACMCAGETGRRACVMGIIVYVCHTRHMPRMAVMPRVFLDMQPPPDGMHTNAAHLHGRSRSSTCWCAYRLLLEAMHGHEPFGSGPAARHRAPPATSRLRPCTRTCSVSHGGQELLWLLTPLRRCCRRLCRRTRHGTSDGLGRCVAPCQQAARAAGLLTWHTTVR